MKKILFFLFFIISILTYKIYINNLDNINNISNKALFKFSREQFKKRNLKLSAIGSGGGENDVNLLSLDFFTKNELTIESGRKELMELAYEFLESLNQDKQLEKYLSPFPFNFINITLSLSVSDPIQGHKYYPEGFTKEKKITYLILSRGIITYYIHTIPDARMQEIHEESYEEALKILENENIVSL